MKIAKQKAYITKLFGNERKYDIWRLEWVRRRKAMAKTNEDLSREIAELRNEVKQMKEIVNMLFTIIVESEDDEEEVVFPGLSGNDTPRLNN
jgi:cytochrome P450